MYFELGHSFDIHRVLRHVNKIVAAGNSSGTVLGYSLTVYR